jgi:hypothetical protein
LGSLLGNLCATGRREIRTPDVLTPPAARALWFNEGSRAVSHRTADPTPNARLSDAQKLAPFAYDGRLRPSTNKYKTIAGFRSMYQRLTTARRASATMGRLAGSNLLKRFANKRIGDSQVAIVPLNTSARSLSDSGGASRSRDIWRFRFNSPSRVTSKVRSPRRHKGDGAGQDRVAVE